MSRDLENEFNDLAQALREARPTPEPEFTDRLDRVVADHFPPEWSDEVAIGREARAGFGSFTERFRRRMGGRRILLPAMAGFASVLIVATVVVAAVDSNKFGSSGNDDSGTTTSVTAQESIGGSSGDSSTSQSAASGGASAKYGAPPATAVDSVAPVESESGNLRTQKSAPITTDQAAAVPGGSRQRDVALEAEIVLGTDPDGVQDVANEIVSVTDDHNGIVMDSSVTDGEEGRAGASFSLLIPTAQIESAVADFSEIADLRSRSQELTDITAPTNRTEDNVTDSKARIKSLLGELEDAPDEATRQQLEWRIRSERSSLNYYESQLKRLERRADYTPVEMRVETGGDTSSDNDSSGWGISDAIDDAGKMLGVAAGVTVIALAIAIPIGIVVLIALALNRAWVRRSRRRILDEE